MPELIDHRRIVLVEAVNSVRAVDGYRSTPGGMCLDYYDLTLWDKRMNCATRRGCCRLHILNVPPPTPRGIPRQRRP